MSSPLAGISTRLCTRSRARQTLSSKRRAKSSRSSSPEMCGRSPQPSGRSVSRAARRLLNDHLSGIARWSRAADPRGRVGRTVWRPATTTILAGSIAVRGMVRATPTIAVSFHTAIWPLHPQPHSRCALPTVAGRESTNSRRCQTKPIATDWRNGLGTSAVPITRTGPASPVNLGCAPTPHAVRTNSLEIRKH